jgi:hypothetical protein
MHYAFIAGISLVHIYILYRYRHLMATKSVPEEASTFERRVSIVVLLSYLLTLYYKVKTRRGLFILNPCHMSALFLVYLLFAKSTRMNRIIHGVWCSWIYGAIMALIFPHLAGIEQFEVVLYYYEHLAIAPIGYLILSRRYGFMRPTVRNQMGLFSIKVLYQCLALAPLSRLTMVNLNFSLCHSPADGLFKYYGPYYFLVCSLALNLLSYIARWACYFQVQLYQLIVGSAPNQQIQN